MVGKTNCAEGTTFSKACKVKFACTRSTVQNALISLVNALKVVLTKEGQMFCAYKILKR